MRNLFPFVLPLCLALPLSVMGKSPSRETLPAIFCAERDFPEDLNCNFDMLTSFPPFSEEGMRDLYNVDFEFPFVDTFRNVCGVNYRPGESKSPDRLIFEYNTCRKDKKKVDYKMHESTRLTVKYDGLNTYECKFYFAYEETIEGVPFKEKSVVFRLKDYQCGYKTSSGLAFGAQESEVESTYDPKTDRERPANPE